MWKKIGELTSFQQELQWEGKEGQGMGATMEGIQVPKCFKYAKKNQFQFQGMEQVLQNLNYKKEIINRYSIVMCKNQKGKIKFY